MSTTNEAKTHIKHLFNGVGLNMINISIGIVVGLVLTPFFVKSLGTRHYGINETIAIFVGCFMLLDLGIDSAVSRFFTLHYAKKEKAECLEISNTAFFLFLLFGIVGSVCIILFAVAIYLIYPDMQDRLLFFHVLLINGIAFGLTFLSKVFGGVVNGTMNQQLTGIRDVFIRFFGAVLTFIVVYCGGRLYAISFVNFGIVVLNLFWTYRLAKYVFPEFVISRLLFKVHWLSKLFSFAFATFIVFVGDTIASRGGIFVIGAIISLEAVTPFIAVSVKLCELYSSLMATISGGWLISWLTYLYANNEKKLIDESMRLAVKVCTYSASFMFFGLIVWSRDFIMRWMGEEFLVAYLSLVIMATEHWIVFCNMPNTKFLFAVAKHRVLAYCNLVGSIIQVVLMIIFVKLGWGITGVALGYLLVSIPVRGIIIPIYVSRIRQTNFVKYYLSIISYILTAMLGFVIPFLISQQLLAPNYKYLMITGILSVICYFPFVFFFGFNKTEKQKITNIILSSLTKNS
ncbi:MAG: hypothetical protein LBC74_04110 [Planctomycetaceae bacterium]|jgi:O-antigen/teichoic acid export membrane protein|nr:hypothetical protein [Planctomycetaceae bacterium]